MRYHSAIVSCAALFASLAGCEARVSLGDQGQDTGGSAGASQAGASQAGASQAGASQAGASQAGASQAGAGQGDENSNLGECAMDLNQLLPQPTGVICPDQVPNGYDSCDISENGICAWQTTGDDPQSAGVAIFGCYADGTGKSWYGSNVIFGNQGGVHNELCPKVEVTANSSCAGHEDQLCHYAAQDCLCDSSTHAWKCQQSPLTSIHRTVPQEAARLCTSFDETKLVKDLSDSELAQWCEWKRAPLGGTLPLEGPLSPPYDATIYGDLFGGIHYDICLPLLPAKLCELNIRLAPECDATLAELDDCIETLWGNGQSAIVVRHGCAPLMNNPRCQNTVVMHWDSSLGQCPLPIE